MVIPSQPSEPPPAADCGGLDGSRANARAQRSPEPGSEGGTSPKTRDVKLNPPGQEQMTQDSGCLAPVTNTGSSCEGGMDQVTPQSFKGGLYPSLCFYPVCLGDQHFLTILHFVNC